MYDIAKIVKKSTSSLDLANKKILIKFSFFERNTSQGIGFLSVDLYPVDDSTESATTIKTYEIPKYKSPTTGKTYELRDSVDFRPMKANTCDPTTTATVAGSPTNPVVQKRHHPIHSLSTQMVRIMFHLMKTFKQTFNNIYLEKIELLLQKKES